MDGWRMAMTAKLHRNAGAWGRGSVAEEMQNGQYKNN